MTYLELARGLFEASSGACLELARGLFGACLGACWELGYSTCIF